MARRLLAHHMTMTVRAGHIHKFQTGCVCGWSSIPLRSRKTALRSFKRHASQRVRYLDMHPKPLTPEADLPMFPMLATA